jgi:hypothetical protein
VLTLIDSTPGGNWSSSNTSIALVGSSTGLVSGISTGTVIITYSLYGSNVTTVLTVNPLPYQGIINGIDSLCPNDTFTLTETVTGGAWSCSNNSISHISSSGLITALSSGRDTIIYTVSAGGCTSEAQKVFIVRPLSECPNGIGITEINNKMNIFPNPSHGKFTLYYTSGTDDIAEIQILDILGHPILSLKLNSNKPEEITIDAPSGIYFIKALINNEIQTLKLILK